MWDTACFWFHTVLILLGSALLIHFGLVLKKHSASGCSVKTEGVVDSVLPDPSKVSQYSISVRYTTVGQPTKTLYGTLTSSNSYAVGSKVSLYYSPDNPQKICWYRSKWSYFVGAGCALLGLYILMGFALYSSETFRAFYGGLCALDLLRVFFPPR